MSVTDGLAVPRAYVCLNGGPAAERANAALASLSIETTCFDHLPDLLGECDDDAPILVLFESATPSWLGDLAKLVERCPALRPVMVAELPGPDEFLAALSAGVVGFVGPDHSSEAMMRTIRSVLESGVAIPRNMVAPLVSEVRRGSGHVVKTAVGEVRLTDREWEVLHLLLQRRSTREMAETLFVSVGTVRSHISSLLRKLGAVDRADAIRLLERGARRA